MRLITIFSLLFLFFNSNAQDYYDLNRITTDHNYRGDSMNRINEVELLDIKIKDNDTITILKV